MTSKDREDSGSGTAIGSLPFRHCGTTHLQQIEVTKIAKLQTLDARSIDKQHGALDNEHDATASHCLQHYIDNRMELAKLWHVNDMNDPIFVKNHELMAEEKQLYI